MTMPQASSNRGHNRHPGRTLFDARARHPRRAAASAWVAIEPLEPRAFLTVIGVPDLYTATENTPLSVDGAVLSKVLANDTAGTLTPNIASLATPPEFGVLTLNPNGSFNYTPAPNFSGMDSFSYIARYNPDPVTIIHPDNHPWSILHPTNGVNPALSDPDFNITWFLPEGDPLVPPFPGVGTGLMGYGGFDGDDPTTEMVLPNSGNRLTAYFRTTFDFTGDPAMMTGLLADVSIDDGAFIYLNGSLLTTWRIAAGTADNFTARGQEQDDEAPETIDLIDRAPNIASLLIQGTNTLAISIHNENTTNSDLFLKLGLRAYFNQESDPTPVTLQVQNAGQPPVGVPDLYSVLEGGQLNVQPAQGLAANDGELAIDLGHVLDILPPANLPIGASFSADVATGTFSLDLNGASDFHGEITFSYILSDIHGQSAPIPVTIHVIEVDDPPVAADDPTTPGLFTTTQGTTYHSAPFIELLPKRAEWRALNITTGIDPAIADPDFNTTWYTNTGAYNGPAFAAPSPAPFHGGGVDGLTGGTVLDVPPSGSRYTSYYTTTFQFNGDPADVLRLYTELLVDDGAVIYLNGSQVARYNFPTSGSDSFTRMPNSSISTETSYWVVNVANALVTGENFLAISVHNSSAIDGDFGFDLSLNAYLAGGYNLLANDTDSDTPHANLTTRRGTDPQYGFYTNPVQGYFDYTPRPNFFGTDGFSYFAYDGVSNSLQPATVTVHVLDGHLPPILTDKITNNTDYDLLEDTPLDTRTFGVSGSLYARDTLVDVDGEPFDPIFNAIIDDSALSGRIEFDISTGHFTFAPDPEFSGQTFFTYALLDKDGLSNTATVRFNVQAVDDRPVANNDPSVPGAFTTVQNTPFAPSTFFNLLPHRANWQALHILNGVDPAVADTDFGATWFSVDGSYNGPAFTAPSAAPFNYGGVDGLSGGTVLNAPPAGFRYTAYFKTTFNFSGNPTEIARLTANLLVDDGIAIYLNGNLVGRQNFTAPDTFTALAAGYESETTFVDVDLTDIATSLINGVNVLAVSVHQASTDSADLGFDLSLYAHNVAIAELLANDTDVETPATSLTTNIGAPPLYGTVDLHYKGYFRYEPGPNFFGADTFTYFVNDGAKNSLTPATVTILVTDGNLPPVVVDDATLYFTNEDEPLDTSALGAFDSAYRNDGLLDADGVAFDPIIDVIVDDSTTNGTVDFNPLTGHFVFTPEPDFSGVTTFTYQVQDKDGLSTPAVVTIIVSPVNDLPVSNDDFYQVFENGSVGETADLQIIPRFSTWFYNDFAEDLHTQAPEWNQIGFDPLAPTAGTIWKSASAKFGFGDTQTTVLLDSDQPTFYFRKNFTLTGEQASNHTTLYMNILRDDGAVIYINGVEVGRSNMPAGPVDYSTLALNAADETSYFPIVVDLTDLNLFPDGSPLKAGVNVVAVEVHQTNLTSTDVGFDMDITLGDPGVGLLANDTDPEGAILTASLLTLPQFGSVTMTSDGSFLYTPFGDYSGPDSFTYRVSDGTNFSLPATVHIDVISPSDPPGDLNADHLLNAADIDALFARIRQGLPYSLLFDLNSDGAVDQADAALLISGPALLNTFPGDANLDGTAGLGDLVILAANFNQPGGWAMGDFSGDATVSLGDLVLLAENYGQSHPEGLTAPDPAPAAENLVGLDALGLIASSDSEDDEDSDDESGSPADILAELGSELRG